jgi:hypothetical protein
LAAKPANSISPPAEKLINKRNSSAVALTSFSQSSCLQVRDLATEVELELAGGPKAAFTGFGHLLERCRRPKGPAEDRLRRLKLGLAGQAALIEDRFGGIQRLAIE